MKKSRIPILLLLMLMLVIVPAQNSSVPQENSYPSNYHIRDIICDKVLAH